MVLPRWRLIMTVPPHRHAAFRCCRPRHRRCPGAALSFTHDGVTYNYTQTKVGDPLVIRVHAVNGPDFYYVVRNGRVVGRTDDARRCRSTSPMRTPPSPRVRSRSPRTADRTTTEQLPRRPAACRHARRPVPLRMPPGFTCPHAIRQSSRVSGRGERRRECKAIARRPRDAARKRSSCFRLSVPCGRRLGLETVVCVTGQHRALLDQVLDLAGIRPDIDLDLDDTRPVARCTDRAPALWRRHRARRRAARTASSCRATPPAPNAPRLAAYYRRIPVVHVEAGLRSGNLHHPWPEEGNRRIIWHPGRSAFRTDGVCRRGFAGQRASIPSSRPRDRK